MTLTPAVRTHCSMVVCRVPFTSKLLLVRLSAGKARRFYGAVYPRDVRWMHIGVAVINLLSRLKRSPFRVFLHDPRAVHAKLLSAGLTLRSERDTAGWRVVVYERPNGSLS